MNAIKHTQPKQYTQHNPIMRWDACAFNKADEFRGSEAF